ncbi:hypothetical protein [Pseudarthrobacter sp. NIBRBAC000502770]|uniref:hypothetical protein n=1 Tax=Pseudarthrobacter sp. NIBRBAC000502770 TaxID=2590785 RepID=UPI00143D8C38|nr:hypothetical protein [Pseudarthrobacter sp. NIBRBAC000502770]
MAEIASTDGAFIVVFAAAPAAPVETAVVGVLDMPFVPNIQFAHQDLQHGLLRSANPAPSMMALTGPKGNGRIVANL